MVQRGPEALAVFSFRIVSKYQASTGKPRGRGKAKKINKLRCMIPSNYLFFDAASSSGDFIKGMLNPI